MQDTITQVGLWEDRVTEWFDNRVHGKGGYNIIGICGDVVVELNDEWTEDDVESARADMIDHGIPVYAVRGTEQIRVDAQTELPQ